MQLKSIYLLLFTLLSFSSFSQELEKVVLNGDDDYNYFLSIPPEKPAYGALLLLTGFGQFPESIIVESKIPDLAYERGIHTFMISAGNKLHMDRGVEEKLDQAFLRIKEDYGFTKDQFVIGGFSAGGTISLRYAEKSVELGDIAVIQPQAVFTVDSPTDLKNIWNYFNRELEKNFSEAGVEEARYVKDLMLDEIGDPANALEAYNRLNPFDSASKELGNERYLTDIGVRVYHDIDVNWLLKERRRSLFDTNALASSELINRLLLAGNEKAEFMVGETGYRSDGTRHPHSWSIVNEGEFIQWVNSFY